MVPGQLEHNKEKSQLGIGVKNLTRILDLYNQGLLGKQFSIIELGTQQLYCQGEEDFLRKFVNQISSKDPDMGDRQQLTESEITQLANKGLMGDLITACGQTYRALDIFTADHTILFDLNFHDLPDRLVQKFDLVTNFGTTEHIINQFHAMKIIHSLVKPRGLIYHDLPLSGYHTHGYFSYNPLFFQQLASANNYNPLFEWYSRGAPSPTPDFMSGNGYPDQRYFDCGIEFILQKTSSEPFRIPLETSTSLDVSFNLWEKGNPYVQGEGSTSPHTESLPSDPKNISVKGRRREHQGQIQISRFPELVQVSGWDLQRELLRRYWGRITKLIPFRHEK